MPPSFQISGWTSEPEHQKIAEPPFGSFQILALVHRTKNVVGRDLTIEGGDQSLKSIRADDRINILFVHPLEFY